MKYLSVEAAFTRVPMSKDNFLLALKRIGEIDPKNIKRMTLRHQFNQKTQFSDWDYIKRGILNVRKVLNSNLGKNGKYKNRLFNSIARIKVSQRGDEYYCWTHIPHSEYIAIINETYILLDQIDPQYCANLLAMERGDAYRIKAEINKEFLETTAPVQTHIILMSNCTYVNANQHKGLKEMIRR